MTIHRHRVKAVLYAVGFGAVIALLVASSHFMMTSVLGRCLLVGMGSGLVGAVFGGVPIHGDSPAPVGPPKTLETPRGSLGLYFDTFVREKA